MSDDGESVKKRVSPKQKATAPNWPILDDDGDSYRMMTYRITETFDDDDNHYSYCCATSAGDALTIAEVGGFATELEVRVIDPERRLKIRQGRDAGHVVATAVQWAHIALRAAMMLPKDERIMSGFGLSAEHCSPSDVEIDMDEL